MDKTLVQNMAKQLTDPGEIQTTAELEEATDRLITELTHIANQAVPKRKPNRGSHAPWWSREIAEATGDARRAERSWRALRTPAAKSELDEAVEKQQRLIRRAQTSCWRSTLEEASHDKLGRKMWNIERWA